MKEQTKDNALVQHITANFQALVKQAAYERMKGYVLAYKTLSRIGEEKEVIDEFLEEISIWQ